MSEFVSLESVCDGRGYLVRYHPEGGGYGTPWSFVVLAEQSAGVWSLRAGWGEMTRGVWKQIRIALTAAGLPDVRWQRPGREVVVPALNS